MTPKTVVWLLGLLALAGGLVLLVVALAPLVSSITGGDAAEAESGLDSLTGPVGIAAAALLILGAVLLAAGERQSLERVVKVRCPSCHALNRETAEFCGKCGAPL